MTTVVELEIPADRLGLSPTFDRVPSFEFQLAEMIGGSPPLVWASAADRDQLEAALEDDPTVETIASLAESREDRWLFRLEFDRQVKVFDRIVTDHDGAILEASGRRGSWSTKLLFHDRESLSDAHDMLEEYDYRASVQRLSDMDGSGSGPALTQTQYETIVAAHELGYFDVPRQVTLQELADELDVSHQALSERLRRSHAALVSEQLSNRLAPAGIEP